MCDMSRVMMGERSDERAEEMQMSIGGTSKLSYSGSVRSAGVMTPRAFET